MLSNAKYSAKVSQIGSGESTVVGTKTNQLISDGDGFGRVIFIRDNDSGEFWSIGHLPAGKPYETFQTTHRPGSTAISSGANGIEATATVFVPEDDACEIWLLRLQNTSKKKRRLSLFCYFNLPDIGNSDVELKNNCLAINSKNIGDNTLAYFALDHGVDSYDTSREIFIGPYRTIHNPRALEDGKCSRSVASTNPIAVIQKNITFGAGTVSETIVVAGLEEVVESANSFVQERSFALRRAHSIVEKYRRVHVAANALGKVQKNWQKLEDSFTVKTPDEALNISQTTWAKYQNITASNLAHTHFSTANAAKQLITIVPLDTEVAREKLLELLELQLKDGRAVESIDNQSGHARVTDHTAGPVWLMLAAASYINETGDEKILKHQTKYFDGGSGSVSEHLVRLAKHCVSSLNSQHLLAVNAHEDSGQTGQLAMAIKELLPILALTGEHDLTRHYQNRLDQIKQSFNRRLWDGSWYLARRNHKKVGSKKNPYHKIDAEAQIWAVLSGLATPERAEKALNMAWRQAGSPVGVANLQPAYPKYDGINAESANAVGEKSNGGVNVSLAALLLWSEAKLGRGDLAYQAFQRHNPAYLSGNQDNYKAEPFIYPPFINGPASTTHGRAVDSWQKNPGGWMWRIVNERMLGAQPTIGGLKIDPCIPRDWRQAEFSRHFRGADYHIRIYNPARQSKGVDRVVVDGIKQTGNVIKPFQTGLHYVEVYLG